MLTGEKEAYFLVVSRPEPAGRFPFQELARILSSALSVSVQDAAVRLRRTWGVLHKTGSLEEARALSQKLAAGGFACAVLSSSNVKAFPALKPIRKAVPAGEGLIIPESGTMDAPYAKGREVLVPWDRFSLVCAGSFFEEDPMAAPQEEKQQEEISGVKVVAAVALMAATGMPSFGKLRPKKSPSDGGQSKGKMKEFNFYLDLISAEGPGSLRICGGAFDYSYLGARKEPSALLNFRKLVPDVLRCLPGALRNRGASAIEERAADGFKYGDRQEYEGERFWLFQNS